MAGTARSRPRWFWLLCAKGDGMKKRVTARRQKLAALTLADRQRRCDFCQRALPVGYLVTIGAATTLRYCDSACADSALERAAFQRPS